MSLKPGLFTVMLIATGAAVASIASAPITAADPIWPFGGAEPADATIQDLEAQGYTVQINWVSGYPTVPLYECWVDDIHNPNGSAPPSRDTLAIVWVDIGCPSSNFD
jgi:hypothetical protein